MHMPIIAKQELWRFAGGIVEKLPVLFVHIFRDFFVHAVPVDVAGTVAADSQGDMPPVKIEYVPHTAEKLLVFVPFIFGEGLKNVVDALC